MSERGTTTSFHLMDIPTFYILIRMMDSNGGKIKSCLGKALVMIRMHAIQIWPHINEYKFDIL